MNKCAASGLGVAATFLALIVLSKVASNKVVRGSDTQPSRRTIDKYRRILEQAKHWALSSRQDSEILLALVHITLAVGKVQTLSTLLTNTEAQTLLQVDLEKLLRSLQDYQAKVLAGFQEAAPGVALSDAGLTDADLFV